MDSRIVCSIFIKLLFDGLDGTARNGRIRLRGILLGLGGLGVRTSRLGRFGFARSITLAVARGWIVGEEVGFIGRGLLSILAFGG